MSDLSHVSTSVRDNTKTLNALDQKLTDIKYSLTGSGLMSNQAFENSQNLRNIQHLYSN